MAYTATTGSPPGAHATASAATLPAPAPTTLAGAQSGGLPGAVAIAARVHTKLAVRRAELDVLENHAASIRGTLRPRVAGAVVTLQLQGAHGWKTVSHTRTGARGRYRLSYTPRATTSVRARVRFGGDAHDFSSRRLLGRLNSYRLAGASWYGGGGGLACGGSLTDSTIGVANKTLPCGTLVTLRYNGRSLRVPVVDRGPYVAGRDFDLTAATKRALGFGDTGNVWSTR
ncbi:MAG TPA: septal ring lytic transglycosylase RlpA family protein [Solirubrobacteraceae bacterium]|nr:septal ring lytic transglycosylase RlpA family protein [Solirubrobacteraceae bacterium]